MKGMRKLAIVVLIILSLVIVKVIRVRLNTKTIGTFETEKQDILARKNYLAEKLLDEPQNIIAQMPSILGEQFQGEWALYSCSMFTAALVNIARLYPETKDEALTTIDSLINIVISPELRRYDAMRWGEDPLETLDGDDSHISYLSHLAWMIGGYKSIGGGKQFDVLYDDVCTAMNRRMTSRENLCLETYPGEYIYIPDVLVAVVALSYYSVQNNGKFHGTVENWVDLVRNNCLDEKTGIIPSFTTDYLWKNIYPVKGSYTALSCYYLTFIDEEFAREQYDRLMHLFVKKHPVFGIREYYNKRRLLAADVDAGIIIFSLSPTGTAFSVGPATYFGDRETRTRIMKTAEIAGTTTLNRKKEQSHYRLANMALVGEAIMLAMRTHIDTES